VCPVLRRMARSGFDHAGRDRRGVRQNPRRDGRTCCAEARRYRQRSREGSRAARMGRKLRPRPSERDGGLSVKAPEQGRAAGGARGAPWRRHAGHGRDRCPLSRLRRSASAARIRRIRKAIDPYRRSARRNGRRDCVGLRLPKATSRRCWLFRPSIPSRAGPI
jgi:hypothetical protein